MVGFKVPNFLTLKMLVFQFGISKSNLKSNFRFSPASEASRGVYWNQAQKNFTHPYMEYPWVSVTLWLCNSVAIINLFKLAPFAGGPWNLPHKFQLNLIYCPKQVSTLFIEISDCLYVRFWVARLAVIL